MINQLCCWKFQNWLMISLCFYRKIQLQVIYFTFQRIKDFLVKIAQNYLNTRGFSTQIKKLIEHNCKRYESQDFIYMHLVILYCALYLVEYWFYVSSWTLNWTLNEKVENSTIVVSTVWLEATLGKNDCEICL